MMNIKSYLGVNAFGEKENGEKMEHNEMYGTIVDDLGLDTLVPYLPEQDQNKLKDFLDEDEYLNNIPLGKWDMRHVSMREELKRLGITSVSMSDTLCTLKAAARKYANKL